MLINDSVVQHVAKIISLRICVKKMADLTIIANILGSLPSKFDALVMPWETVVSDNQATKTDEKIIYQPLAI